MTTRPPRWRARRRPLLYGITAMLCGTTIALAALSVVGYVRYQKLDAEARTATARALETQRFAVDMGLLTADGRLLLACGNSLCSIALKLSANIASAAARSENLRVVSKSGSWCEISDNLFFKPSHASNTIVTAGSLVLTDDHPMYIAPVATSRPRSPDAAFSCVVDPIGPSRLIGMPGPDGQTRATAVIGMGSVDHIDFLDEAGKTIFSIEFSRDREGTLRLTASAAAGDAAQAAKNAMKNLVTVSGGAFLAFIALSALGRIAARGRRGPRRAQRREATGSEVRQQSLCGKTWADKVTMGLIDSAVRALDHPDDQDRYREEWAADSDELPGKWQRLRWALLMRLCAPMGIRSARRDALSMSPPQQQ